MNEIFKNEILSRLPIEKLVRVCLWSKSVRQLCLANPLVNKRLATRRMVSKFMHQWNAPLQENGTTVQFSSITQPAMVINKIVLVKKNNQRGWKLLMEQFINVTNEKKFITPQFSMKITFNIFFELEEMIGRNHWVPDPQDADSATTLATHYMTGQQFLWTDSDHFVEQAQKRTIAPHEKQLDFWLGWWTNLFSFQFPSAPNPTPPLSFGDNTTILNHLLERMYSLSPKIHAPLGYTQKNAWSYVYGRGGRITVWNWKYNISKDSQIYCFVSAARDKLVIQQTASVKISGESVIETTWGLRIEFDEKTQVTSIIAKRMLTSTYPNSPRQVTTVTSDKTMFTYWLSYFFDIFNGFLPS